MIYIFSNLVEKKEKCFYSDNIILKTFYIMINEKDLIYISGHKGMVGSSIYKLFIEKGYKNIVTADRENLDLTDFHEVKKWYEGKKPNITIIAAAKVGGIFANNNFSADFLLENLKIQNNLIENAWRSKSKRLLFLGSSCIYPKFANQPISEEELLSGPLEKTNDCYAIAKIAGLRLCKALREQYGFDAISLMPTNLYGPNDNYHPKNSHVLPALIGKFCDAFDKGLNEVSCWGTGNPMREFLHVEDLASACLHLLKNWNPSADNAPKDKFGNYLNHLNVGTSDEISIKNLAKLVAKLVGYKGEILWDKSKPDGTPRKKLNISRIQSLGWEPSISLEKGICQAISDYRNNSQIRKS